LFFIFQYFTFEVKQLQPQITLIAMFENVFTLKEEVGYIKKHIFINYILEKLTNYDAFLHIKSIAI